MNIKLYSVERGEGFPLVLLHGNGEDGAYFIHQLEHFSAQYRVIAVDTRGHGRSPRGGAPFTLEQFAEDLKGFLDEKGLKRIHLLGFSDGANIAMLFTLRYPEYVEKLILNGGNLDPGGVEEVYQQPICEQYERARLKAASNPKAAAKMELLALMVEQPHIDPADLAAIPCPTLVIAGEEDLIKEEHTRLICDSIPNAALAILPGDHFVANQNSTAFNRVVERFLSERSTP